MGQVRLGKKRELANEIKLSGVNTYSLVRQAHAYILMAFANSY